MHSPTPAARQLDEWRSDIEALADRARALAAGLSDAQLHERPPSGGWSVALVFEHLVVTDALYLPILERLAAQAPHVPAPPAWKPGWAARLLLKYMDPANLKPSPSPGKFRPGPKPRANVLDAYLANLARYRRVLEQAAGVDLNRPRLSSPALALLRLSLGDALRVQIVHSQRHLGQIERTRRAIGA